MTVAGGSWTSLMTAADGARLPLTSADYQQVHEWLLDEAEMLDQGRWDDWMARIAPEIDYRVPLRETVAGSRADSVSMSMDLFHDDHYALSKRVERLGTEHAWAEDPPTRTRRFVSNIGVFAGPSDEHVVSRSYLLVYLSRGDTKPDVISAVRGDAFRRSSSGLLLAARTVVIDEAVVRTQSLTSVL